MQMRIGFYASFWRACAIDAWRGSWGLANAIGAVVGGALLTIISYVFDFKDVAPALVKSTIAFGLVVTSLSIVAAWIVIYVVRFFGAPARLNERSQKKIEDLSRKLIEVEKSIQPKFALSFHPEAEGIARTPIQKIFVGRGADGNPLMSTYVRIRVEAISKNTVKNCKAFLTGLEKESADGKSLSTIALPHGIALKNGQMFDVYPNVICHVDFLICTSDYNRLNVPDADWPLELQLVFNDTGTYHFTLTVNGDGLSESITVAVAWPGTWDKITARQILMRHEKA